MNDVGSGSALRSLKPNLLQIWSSANCCWKGKQRAPQREKDEIPVEINSPHVCLLGMTQPQTFFCGASRADITDGWLARPLFLISQTRPRARLHLPEVAIPKEILDAIGQFGDEPEPDAPIRIAPASETANALLDAFSEKVLQIMVKSDREKSETAALYGKAVENARHVALTLAVGKNPVDPIIEAEDMAYAVALVDYTICAAIKAIDENLAENELERFKKRLLKTIREAGGTGITRKELTRKSQYLKRLQRDECLDDLVTAGQIEAIRADNGADLFRIV